MDELSKVRSEKPQRADKDYGTLSQQSSLQAELNRAPGTKGSPQIIRLQLHWVKSHFSEEEKDFFSAAAIEGKVSQTHYTNPDADMCFRCPICAKLRNPTGLTKHTSRHFLRMHNTPNREYRVILHEEPWKEIKIKTGGNTARRSGADPPPIAEIQDQVEQAGNPSKVTQRHKLNTIKHKQKQKGKQTRKKRRPMGQQIKKSAKISKTTKVEGRKWKERKVPNKARDRAGQPTIRKWINVPTVNPAEEVSMDKTTEDKEEHMQLSDGGSGIQSNEQQKQDCSQRTMQKDSEQDKAMVVESKEASEQEPGKSTAQGKQGKQQKPTMERIAQEQYPQPKRRQKTILEFTSRLHQDHPNGTNKDKEGKQGELDEHAHHREVSRPKGGRKEELHPVDHQKDRDEQECDQPQDKEMPKAQ